MDSLLFLIIGALIVLLVMKRPLIITIKHVYERKEPELSVTTIPNMADIMKAPGDPEDETYKKMGEMYQEITEAVRDTFGGSDRV